MTKAKARVWPTTGPRVCEWIERFLVHGEGDFYGEPFRLLAFQKAIIYRKYEYNKVTRKRRYNRVLVGLPKGSGKTELGAALGLYSLLGDDPLDVGTPDVPVAAASYDQANLLFGAAKAMVTHERCPLGPYVEAFDAEIQRKDRPGTLYRVAAAAGTNDGRKPSALFEDECHEWTGNKVRVHTVLLNGLAKRANTQGMFITTAGVKGADSVAEQLYERAQLIASGDLVDNDFLAIWYSAPETLNIDQPDQLLEAIHTANPAADDFWPAQRLVTKFNANEIPRYEFERYHLNRWTNAAANPYLPPGAFDVLNRRDPAPPGAEVWAMFDGSYKRDASAIWAAWHPTPDQVAVFRIDLWERPPDAPDSWQVDRRQVDARMRQLMATYKVARFGLDPYGWHDEADRWAEDYGDTVVMVPTNEIKRWSAYCSRFYALVVSGGLDHDHDGALARHLNNAVPRETAAGTYIQKERRSSPRRIDAAIAAVGAVGLAMEHKDAPPPVEAKARWL